MLEVLHFTKRYNNTTAVDDLSFTLDNGTVTVLLGPNGAGKSTVMKSIVGFLRFDGSIKVNGNNNNLPKSRRDIGYIPEIPSFYPNLTVAEHMEFIARTYRLKNYKEYSEYLLKRFELYQHRKKFGDELSKGMQQKLNICLGLLTKPNVILLDEPFIGLDPHAIKELRSAVLEMKDEGCTLLISTHMIDSVSNIWDRTIIMKKGKMEADISKEEFEGMSTETLEDLFFDVTEAGV